MKKKEPFRPAIYALSLLGLLVFFGVIYYFVFEGLSITEAFFMTIITMSTVGFREVKPLSNPGMWFTAFLIIVSFGIFAYAVTTLTRYVVDGIFRNYYKDNKVKRKIDKLNGHVIVCGYGRNGQQAVAELKEHKEDIIVVEKEPEIVESIRLHGELLYLDGDATEDDILGQAKIEQAKALITTLPDDAENLFVVLSARQINPKLTIISRASHATSDIKLKRAGANNVIMPDKIGGQRMAKLVAQPDVVEFLDYIMLQSTESVTLEELSCSNMSDAFKDKSIRELDVRNESGANIIGMKRRDNTYLINPLPEVLLTSSDKLFVLGTSRQITSLKKILTLTPGL
jgi:voltage-gated potassium channel